MTDFELNLHMTNEQFEAKPKFLFSYTMPHVDFLKSVSLFFKVTQKSNCEFSQSILRGWVNIHM